MAEHVGTSRQNIENLEAKPDMVPRYVAKLAKALGATVDDLISGHGSAAVTLPAFTSEASGTVARIEQRRGPTLGQLLEGLSAHFIGLDDAAKRRVKSQLADLVDAPEDHQSLAEIMATTLKIGNASQNEKGLENSTSSRAG